MSTQHSNALIRETSPYLLQHAHNPVQWYPWGEKALALAKQQDKPILLSIGYSACHWCHVMAHESFEDSKTAEVMNELFINIKVDREERPDLDKIYQTAHQLLTQRPGGWPLTMFLDPNTHYPFFGGTYFPPHPRYGMPAFLDLLKNVSHYFCKQRDKVVQQNHVLSEALASFLVPNRDRALQISTEPLALARSLFSRFFDNRHGGFGGAPKFPHLPELEWLLHHYITTCRSGNPDEESAKMALFTLKRMALGGIYDQLGGGFYRYAVDEAWSIPHFEKMLYDNGPFLTVYSEAWQLLQTHPHLAIAEEGQLFERVTLGTADWVLREMQAPEGGFYSTLDADSEGEEGKFYIWTKEKIKVLLNGEFYSTFAYHMGLTCSANFEGQYWHLHIYHEPSEVAKKFNLPLLETETLLNQAKAILLNARQQRVRPGRDEKILTSWNAMMIKGLATAGRIFGRQDYLQAAEHALNFIKNTLWVNGRLLATYKDGKAQHNAYLDDYAFLLEAILTLLQARWSNSDLSFAIQLAEVLLDEFEDTQRGGFYFTAHHHETLIMRTKSFSDDALPSGNGIAALALGRLGCLIGETRYLQAAERTLQIAWSTLCSQSVHNHCAMLLALEDYLFPPQIVILRGQLEVLETWQISCQHDYAPQRVCIAIPHGMNNLPVSLSEKKPQGEIIAYVCKGQQCNPPVTSLETLMGMLQT